MVARATDTRTPGQQKVFIPPDAEVSCSAARRGRARVSRCRRQGCPPPLFLIPSQVRHEARTIIRRGTSGDVATRSPHLTNGFIALAGSLDAGVESCRRVLVRWGSHPKYGRQFRVHSYATVLPATVQGIRRYLGSGLIKGIGPVMAERMVAHFGTGILDVIEQEPGRLAEVHGPGPKRTQMIANAWQEQKAVKEVMVFLSGVGVSTSLAVRIYKKYAGASIAAVRDEPFRLASEVWGIGFKTADTIAAARQPRSRSLGILADRGPGHVPARDLAWPYRL
jgi:hypothetical protein